MENNEDEKKEDKNEISNEKIESKSEENNNKKEKTKKKFQNNMNIEEEMKGFLIFTDKHREKNCIRDSYNILNDVTEKLYSNLDENDNNNINLNEEVDIKNNDNISSKIEEE